MIVPKSKNGYHEVVVKVEEVEIEMSMEQSKSIHATYSCIINESLQIKAVWLFTSS